MNYYLLHVTADSERPMPAWQTNLFNRGIVVMPARTLQEALQYARVYNVLLILIDLVSDDWGLDRIREILDATAARAAEAPQPQPPPPPIIGVTESRPDAETLDRMAQAGLADVIASEDPEAFILWKLDLLLQLSGLRHFEQSRMEIGELSRQTRIHLHDLSQPLSAIQGRLQLMAAKCPAGEPNAQMYQELVRLAFDVTGHLMEIQQLHRQFS